MAANSTWGPGPASERMILTSTQRTPPTACFRSSTIIASASKVSKLRRNPYLNQLKMAEEDGQELVTKPFKFVTGEPLIPSLPNDGGDCDPTLTCRQLVSPRNTRMRESARKWVSPFRGLLGHLTLITLRHRCSFSQPESDEALLAELR